jgi:hypothetical protein
MMKEREVQISTRDAKALDAAHELLRFQIQDHGTNNRVISLPAQPTGRPAPVDPTGSNVRSQSGHLAPPRAPPDRAVLRQRQPAQGAVGAGGNVGRPGPSSML